MREGRPDDRAFDSQKHALIEERWLRINPCFREAVVLRDVEDLSYEEIAEILQISTGDGEEPYPARKGSVTEPVDRAH